MSLIRYQSNEIQFRGMIAITSTIKYVLILELFPNAENSYLRYLLAISFRFLIRNLLSAIPVINERKISKQVMRSRTISKTFHGVASIFWLHLMGAIKA
mgnify:CR=1 FL=1